VGKAGHITDDYKAMLKDMIMADLPKDALLALLEAIPSCPSACVPSTPVITQLNSIKTNSTHCIEKGGGKRLRPKRLLPAGVKARYLENGEVVHEEKTPTDLAKYLRIKQAKFVLTGHEWDGTTYGTEGYRTTVHAFTTNGYEVDIGDGWGEYKKEFTKPYAKFDVRKGV